MALRQKAPGIRVAVQHLNAAQLEHQLASGEVDIAIATPEPGRPHLRSFHLFDETYVLIGWRAHPQLKPGLSIEHYVQLEHGVVSLWGGIFTTPIDDALAA